MEVYDIKLWWGFFEFEVGHLLLILEIKKIEYGIDEGIDDIVGIFKMVAGKGGRKDNWIKLTAAATIAASQQTSHKLKKYYLKYKKLYVQSNDITLPLLHFDFSFLY